MLDKWKTKNALYEAYKLYREKKMSYLKVSTIELYQQFESIQYAIAYVLCEHFNFKCNNPFSYKWYITYDYTYYYYECKEAYEKIIKQNDTTKHNYIAGSIDDFKGNYYSKGDIIHDMKNGCFYCYDGNNFINICVDK